MKDTKGENKEVVQNCFYFCIKQDRDPKEKKGAYDRKTVKSVNILLFFFQIGKICTSNLRIYV